MSSDSENTKNLDAATDDGSEEQRRPSQALETVERTVTANTRKSAKRAAVVMALVAALVAVVLNLPFSYEVAATKAVGKLHTTVDFSHTSQTPPRMAGFPYRYSIGFADRGTDEGAWIFSLRALLYNFGIALIPILLLSSYAYRRTLRTQSGRLGKKTLTIADLLAITMVLALPLGIWQRVNQLEKSELEFAGKIHRSDGGAQLVCWVPTAIAGYVPATFAASLCRIHAVRVENPSSELLKEVLTLKHLECLRIGGSEYDLRVIDHLAGNPLLSDVRIAGRKIDTRVVQSIVSNPAVDTLNLMRTNINAEGLSLLAPLQNLRRLNLMHTDVRLSELGNPSWSKSIQELLLPHPESGGDALTIQGWPSLQRLGVNEFDTAANATPVKVVLESLPELRSLELDAFQKFDLTLRDLPQLSKLDEQSFEWRSRIPRGGTAPGALWFSKLVVENLPSFESGLAFYCVDLEKLRLRQVPKIPSLGVGAFYRTVTKAPYVRELTTDAATALVNGLGESDGPTSVDLDAVPLAGVDLTPLTKNKGLKDIRLSYSGTNLEQWKQLEGMDWLTRLEVAGNPINAEGLSWILEAFPKLEHLAFSPPSAYPPLSLEIVDRPNLKTVDIVGGKTLYLDKLRIVNSPNVSMELNLGYVSELELVNAQSIRGLSVASPLPEKVKIQGLRDLNFLALGGPKIDDRMIDTISNCKNLNVLTLAYPSASAEAIKSLPTKNLFGLYMPGANIDDSVIESWADMPDLKYLDLSDTMITGKGAPKLLASESLVVLRLDRTAIQPKDLMSLREHIGLDRLSLAGVGIDAKSLDVVLGNGLQRLDLSGTKVDPNVLTLIQTKGNQLRHLDLRECKLDPQAFSQLVQSNRELLFDLTGSDAATRSQAALLGQRRISTIEEYEERLEWEARINASMYQQIAQSYEPSRPKSLIHTKLFDPKTRRSRSVSVALPGTTVPMPSDFVPVASPPTAKKESNGIGDWLSRTFLPGTADKETDEARSTDESKADLAEELQKE